MVAACERRWLIVGELLGEWDLLETEKGLLEREKDLLLREREGLSNKVASWSEIH